MVTRIDFGAGRTGLEALREHTRDVCDVDSLVAPDNFRAECEISKVGSTVFILSSSTSVAYTRRPVHIARSGDDHYQIRFQLNGISRSARNELIRERDVCTHDMNCPSVTEVHGTAQNFQARSLIWIVPRMLLVQLTTNSEVIHGMRLAASIPYTRLFTDHLWSVWKNAPNCSEREGETAAHSLLLLLAGSLGHSEDSGAAVSNAARTARLDAIKRYVESQLKSADLNAQDVAQKFGLSRASLYRVFEPERGFASYLRSRRLHRAARLLSSAAHRHLRILDIALESHFSNEASFTRAFRREFRLTPAELRASIDAHGIMRPASVEPLKWLRNRVR